VDARKIYDNLKASLRPEVAALYSYFHYHARGMHYVNLLRSPQLTAKVYFTTREFELNPSGYAVNPHDHAYNFDTYVLRGAARNIIFETQEGADWCHYTYRSPLNGGKGFTPKGVACLRSVNDTYYDPGQHYYLRHDQIHTITIGVGTAIFLLQYEDQPKEQTNFFHDKAEPPSTEGLYKPMTPFDVERMVAEYLP
jgi:hypothetical protein